MTQLSEVQDFLNAIAPQRRAAAREMCQVLLKMLQEVSTEHVIATLKIYLQELDQLDGKPSRPN